MLIKLEHLMYKKLLMLSLIKIRTYAYYNEPSNVCDLAVEFYHVNEIYYLFAQWNDVIKIRIIYWN